MESSTAIYQDSFIMSQRIDYARAAPEGYKAFGAVHAYLRQCGLPEALVNLS